MALVYISYSRQDMEFVDRLAADLRTRGIDAWVDRARLEGGTDWASATQIAIDQATVILVVVSKSSTQSAWARREYLYAQKSGKRVIPLLIEDVDGPPLYIASVQFIDFRRNYQEALDRLLGSLPDTARSIEPLPPEVPSAKGYFFLSYAEEDTDFVLGMRQFLEERRYGYFDFQESERDYYGTQMFLELERQITQAAAVFCILSPDWKVSTWAPKEYLFALDVGIPTFLLMSRAMGPTLITAGVPYIDFVKDKRKGFAKLDKELRRKKLT